MEFLLCEKSSRPARKISVTSVTNSVCFPIVLNLLSSYCFTHNVLLQTVESIAYCFVISGCLVDHF
jgi:hypothetical protein